MRRRKRFVARVFAGAVLLGFVLWGVWALVRPPDPVYGGRHLSEILVELYGYGVSPWLASLPVPKGSFVPKKSQGSWLEAAQDVLDARTLLSKHKPGREALPLLTNWLASSWASQLKAGEWLARHNADVFGWRHDRQMLGWLFLSEHPIATAQELIPFLPLMNTNARSYDLGPALEAVKKALDVSTNVNVEPALEILLPIKYQLEPQSDSYDYIPRMLSVGPTRGVSELNWILHVIDPHGIHQALYNLEKGPSSQLPGAARTLA